MAYRTYINGHEWLGNNESSEIIFEELKRQGCPFDEEYCVKDFEVKDLDRLVKAVEKHLYHLYEARPRMVDTLGIFKLINEDNRAYTLDQLTLRLQEFRECGYIFVSATLLEFIGKENVDWEFYWKRDKKTKELVCHYRLINNGKCIFSAY